MEPSIIRLFENLTMKAIGRNFKSLPHKDSVFETRATTDGFHWDIGELRTSN